LPLPGRLDTHTCQERVDHRVTSRSRLTRGDARSKQKITNS